MSMIRLSVGCYGVSDFRGSGYYKPYDSGTNNDYDNGMNLENSDIYDFEEEFGR